VSGRFVSKLFPDEFPKGLKGIAKGINCIAMGKKIHEHHGVVKT
jgi:hypothetical protein